MTRAGIGRLIKKSSDKKLKESGCCFRSCGGAPVIQQDDPRKIYKNSSIRKLNKKVKEIWFLCRNFFNN